MNGIRIIDHARVDHINVLFNTLNFKQLHTHVFLCFMTIFLLYIFIRSEMWLSWWQEDAESFSITSHMLLSHQQKLPLSESELDYWDRERNTTLHITPRYNWARVTRNLTTDSRLWVSRLRWLLPAQRLEFGRHKITRQTILGSFYPTKQHKTC